MKHLRQICELTGKGRLRFIKWDHESAHKKLEGYKKYPLVRDSINKRKADYHRAQATRAASIERHYTEKWPADTKEVLAHHRDHVRTLRKKVGQWGRKPRKRQLFPRGQPREE